MKTNLLFAVLAAAAVMFTGCNKMDAPLMEENQETSKVIPEGYTEVMFAAGLEDDTKTVLDETNELQVNWTGEEDINVWYRENGTAKKVAATILSYSGKNAYISAAIPSAVADTATAYYAEMNGVSDASGKAPFGSGNTRARVTCPRVQNAVEGSFDPDAAAMGAKWTGDAGATPSFAFKQLNNLLKISIDNQTTKQIDSIVINNDASIDSTYLANVCYWDFEKGYLSIAGSGNKSRSVCLKGSIGAGQGDYYFVISVRNTKGYPELKNMSIVFYLHEGDVKYTRTFTNSTTMRSIGGYNQLVKLTGNNALTILDKDLVVDTSSYAPFGTYWGTSFISTWHTAGFTANTAYTGTATYDTRTVPTAKATASCSSTLQNPTGTNNARMKGKFSFEFIAAESGTGVLSFRSVPGSTTHTTSVLKNGELVQKISYTSTSTRLDSSVEISVTAGDKIKIQYNNTTGNAAIECSDSYKIKWDKKTE